MTHSTNNDRVLVTIISGKRPGGVDERPTEKFFLDFDEVIVSNNSDDYYTDFEIIDVPEEYQEWYKENVKTSDIAYYAPMNRSYAMKYAKEHGYRYNVQLDDNIKHLEISYAIGDKKYRTTVNNQHSDVMLQKMLEYFRTVLQETNAGIVGMDLNEASVPGDEFLRERFVYSCFMIDLERVPEYYHGDFEDDIEFRYKLQQMGVPMIKVLPFKYGKVSQAGKDLTGNRSAYQKVGSERGNVVAKIYGDQFERGTSTRGSGTARGTEEKFRHRMKGFKVGVTVNDIDRLKKEMAEILEFFAEQRTNEVKYGTSE